MRTSTDCFYPLSAKLAEYRRARLLNEYVLTNGRDRDLYLKLRELLVLGRGGGCVWERVGCVAGVDG